MSDALRLVVYDATQRFKKPLGLGLSWTLGGPLYRALGRVDAAFGASSFASALDWLARYEDHRPISEVQYWGHGKWGRVFLGRETLDRAALQPQHPLRPKLDALRERLTPNALLWFRTCETLGAQPGQDFAAALADYSGARIAGHTFVIGYFQSGLHELAPGMPPHWPANEGLARGTAESPLLARTSGPHEPHTITCFTGQIPAESRRG
jgi:hypothetical protein